MLDTLIGKQLAPKILKKGQLMTNLNCRLKERCATSARRALLLATATSKVHPNLNSETAAAESNGQPPYL